MNLSNIPPVTPFLSEQEIDVLRRTLLKQFTEDEQESFLRQCQRSLLDPFSKQIFATRRWSKGRDGTKTPTLTVVTSILGLTAIAARTGQYDGCITTWCGKDGIWREEWIADEFPAAAKCVVHVKNRTYPEVGIARWEGYVGRAYDQSTKRWEVTDFWERLPDFMLGKCAKAQALRGAFPDQCSNIYISEELQGGISEADQLNDEEKIATNRKKEEELLKKAKAEGVKIVESKPAPKPTPAEAAAPAFPEPPQPQPVPASVQVTDSAPQEMPDDLDMEPSQPPQPEPSAEAPAGPPAWAEHVIQGLRNDKYLGRKVGDLSPVELAAIEANWLPKVREVLAKGEKLKQAQQDDAVAFEEAIKHSKLEKPW